MKDLSGKVKKLNLPIGKFAIFGSGPMGAREIRECKDADIIVTADLFNNLKNNLGWKIKINKYGDECLENGNIEIWKNWRPGEWNIEKLIDDAEIINGLPFVKLGEVLKWKKMMGRDKDIADIQLIKDYL